MHWRVLKASEVLGGPHSWNNLILNESNLG